MRRRAAALAAALALALTACAGTAAPQPTPVPTPTAAPQPTPDPTPSPTPAPDGVDLDLTSLSSTMVFAEVAAMVSSPEDFAGKTVRMQGQLVVYEANPALDIDYFYTVVIRDATACCQQGMEFVWDGGELPAEGTELLVTGKYQQYDCGGWPSYHVVADTVEIVS